MALLRLPLTPWMNPGACGLISVKMNGYKIVNVRSARITTKTGHPLYSLVFPGFNVLSLHLVRFTSGADGVCDPLYWHTPFRCSYLPWAHILPSLWWLRMLYMYARETDPRT